MSPAALSAGWQVTVEAESQGWYPFVGDKSVVVGAIAEIVGADLTEDSPTIEQIDELVEAIDEEYGVWSVPLTHQQVADIAAGAVSELIATDNVNGGLVYIRIETV